MKKIINSSIVQTILAVIITVVLLEYGKNLGMPIYFRALDSGNSTLAFMGIYALFIGVWILTLLFWAIFRRYRCMFRIMGPEARGNKITTSLVIGLVFGFGMNLIIGIIAVVCGDIRLKFNEFNILYILAFIAVIMIQSGAEEIVLRGHLFQELRRIFPKYPVVAILGNAWLFSFMHITNPGISVLAVINILCVGVMYALIVYYFDSFWGAVLAHAGWNFCENIFFGLPNSGIVSDYSVFRLDAASAQDGFAYDVNFGIEGSIATLVFLIIGCVIIFIIGRKRNQKPLDIWTKKETVTEQSDGQKEAVTEQSDEHKETVTEQSDEQKETAVEQSDEQKKQ